MIISRFPNRRALGADGQTEAGNASPYAPDTLNSINKPAHVAIAQTARGQVVFETTPDGVTAGRAGQFELVVGVARGDEADALRMRGADLVVADLGEIVEHNLAA